MPWGLTEPTYRIMFLLCTRNPTKEVSHALFSVVTNMIHICMYCGQCVLLDHYATSVKSTLRIWRMNVLL